MCAVPAPAPAPSLANPAPRPILGQWLAGLQLLAGLLAAGWLTDSMAGGWIYKYVYISDLMCILYILIYIHLSIHMSM